MMPGLQNFAHDHCSWCGRELSKHVIPLGVPLEIGPKENALLGGAVEFSADGYVITGFLFPTGSDEKQEGFDLGMVACSNECADQAMARAGASSIRLRPLTEATVRLKSVRA
jgi:hypothetical protein